MQSIHKTKGTGIYLNILSPEKAVEIKFNLSYKDVFSFPSFINNI